MIAGRIFGLAQVALEQTGMAIEDEFFDFVLSLEGLNRVDAMTGCLAPRRVSRASLPLE